MTFRELLWRRALGEYREADAIAWALQELQVEPARPALSSLAGLVPLYNPFEVEGLLVAAIRELGRTEPPRAALYANELRDTVREILEGVVTPEQGCRRLAHGYWRNLDAKDLHRFWILASALDEERAGAGTVYDDQYPRASFDELVRIEARRIESLERDATRAV
ncbi:MAG TPA: hypothetical protein VLC06_09750 [Polyangia bacterium]|jgi:hypothetical protein|nr:hypothetical protein [Polyangia bacterium]